MDSQQRLAQALNRVHQRINEDFSLAREPEGRRAQVIERLTRAIMKGTLIRLGEQLSPDVERTLEAIGSDPSRSDTQKSRDIVLIIVGACGNFERVLFEEYEKFKGLAREQISEERERSFESAENYSEAVSELIDFAGEALDNIGVNSSALSLVSASVELFYDPARFRRTPYKRQKRFIKQLVSLVGATLGSAWAGLLVFTTASALERWSLLGPLPEYVKDLVPSWYARQSIGQQVADLGIAAAALAVFLSLFIVLLVRFGSSKRLTPLFEASMNVNDDELVSKALRSSLRRSFPQGLPEESLRAACGVVYKAIYYRTGKANQEDLKTIEEFLEADKELALVAFLKSKVKSYRDVMQREVAAFSDDANTIMSGI
jgi:hypothetical protein